MEGMIEGEGVEKEIKKVVGRKLKCMGQVVDRKEIIRCAVEVYEKVVPEKSKRQCRAETVVAAVIS